MRVKFGCFFIAFLTSLFSFCYAQTGSSIIRGNVLIQNNQAAEAATVVLLNLPDSSVVMSALVNYKGAYQFLNVPAGAYTILATRLGYKKAYSPAHTVKTGQTIIIPNIQLTAINNELKEVSIVAKTPYVEVRPGKTIINPAASIIADGQSVLDILRQSPGVRVDNGDNISVSGRQGALILIDGKVTNLSGADLAALLKSTQGSNVDRMEIITGGSPKYDAAAGGIVNIVMKKGKNVGTNGTYTASAGYGKYYKANTGIAFNNRTDHYNIFGSYNLSAYKTFKNFDTDRKITYQGVQSNYNTMYRSVYDNLTNNFRLGTDFFPSPGQTIGFLVSGNLNGTDYQKDNTLTIYNRSVKDSTIKAHSDLDRDIHNFSYNLNYSGKLDSSGRTLSANVTYTTNKRHSDEYITNNFFDGTGNVYRAPLLLENLSPTKMRNFSALLDYSTPLSKGAKFEAGLKFSSTKTDNNLIFGPKVGNVYTIDTTFSNYFIYTERIGAGYVNYSGKFGKLDLNAGVRGEYTSSDGNSVTRDNNTKRSYFNLFPTILLNYHYNDKNDYALTFTRGVSRPIYDKLNPFLYFIDLYNYQAGNAYLRPVYANTLSLTHTYNQEISTKLYAVLATGASFPFYAQNDATKVILNTDVNLGRVHTIGLNITAPIKFTNWWTSSYDVDASYQRYIADPQYGDFDRSTGDLIVNTVQSFTITSVLGAEIGGHYETPTLYGINQFKANYYTEAGVSMQLWNKQGKLSLVANDIFNTNRDRSSTKYQNLDRYTVDRREYRVVTLSFSYRFGKTTVKGAARHRTGSEDEQKRMNGAN
ncbi:outer membrane beta-barrel protein [Mucilaginibacter aquariorum]|uniref:TonB dependent receptor n=1 Tax=Mucilaginibacter aquariorum TaxID=2967225 RepID=A0ABT1T143_9SPHI|nr:outer membrane beta-barrel protein [Mucilaginibacter aquariorum]MCQ6958183.1 TonB dependent receptor [Mucilaginibacter aquariorum]